MFKSDAHKMGFEAAGDYDYGLIDKLPVNPFNFGTTDYDDWEYGFYENDRDEF